jgi:hypothetical protein
MVIAMSGTGSAWWRRLWWFFPIVAAGVVATILLWPKAPPAPQARQYLAASACLLTDPGGVVAGSPGAPVWAAMESASLASHVMVSYLSDTGPSGVMPMLNTLVRRQCGVIITAGAPSGAVIAAARANPHQRFLLVLAADGAVAKAPPNAAVVSSAVAAARIGQAVYALAAQA